MNSQQVRIAPTARGRVPPEQKRFNQLIERIEHARERLRAWHAALPAFHQAYGEQVVPLLRQHDLARRNWLLALDQLRRQRRWSKADARTLRELFHAQGRRHLDEHPDDAEILALFEQITGHAYASEEADETADLRQTIIDEFGIDLGDAPFTSEQDVFDRLHAQMRAGLEAKAPEDATAADAWEQAESSAARRRAQARADARERRRQQETAQVTQSVRDIYRKLVSQLHPDREPDPALQRAKTDMLQRVNTAYERNDLLALLEMQLHLEQVDATRLQSLDRATLKRYNSVLAQQLAELEAEFDRTAMQLVVEFGLDPARRPDPARMGTLITEARRDIRESIHQFETEIRWLQDPAVTRDWLLALRAEERAMRRARARDDDRWDTPF